MAFIQKLPVWLAPGVEPPEILKNEGWKAGIKPPDAYFNYLQNTTYLVLKELQEKSAEATDLTGKVDKEPGKGLSSNDFTSSEKTKLAGIEAGANNYKHPATHPPSIILQDPNNRFTSDAEKASWNSAKNDAINWAKGFGVGGAKLIPGGTDLNSLVVPGDYLFASGTLLNAPASGACFIKVLNREQGDLPIQEVSMIYRGTKYSRSRSGASSTSFWHPWESFLTDAPLIKKGVTLLNGWRAGFADREPGYASFGGLLILTGTLKGGTNGDSTPAFVLPVACRPSEYRSISVPTLGTGASANPVNRLGIAPNGAVSVAWNYSVEAIGIDVVVPL